MWASSPAYSIPGLGLRVPSLVTLLSWFVPGLDLLRASGTGDSGARLVASFLAAYGVLALTERRGATIRGVLVALIIVVACLEVFHPRFARRSFGTSVEFRPYMVRPPASLVELYGKMGEGAVVDLPQDYRFGSYLMMAQHALFAAFHGQPIASCYNSYGTPVQAEVAALAARVMSDPNAGDALYALGFRNLVVHALVPGRQRARPIIPRPPPQHLVEVGRTFQHGVYRLESERPVIADFAALAAKADPSGSIVVVAPPVAEISLRFQNRTDATYRHPDPIVPTSLVARWHRSSGALVDRHELKTLLPLALAPAEETTRTVTMRVPVGPGEYRLSLTPAAKPDLVISRAVVLVDASKAEESDGRAARGRR